MNIYRVISNNWEDFDPEDYWRAVIVVAENEVRAMEIAKKGRKAVMASGLDIESNNWGFKTEQFPLKIEKINTDVEQVLMTN